MTNVSEAAALNGRPLPFSTTLSASPHERHSRHLQAEWRDCQQTAEGLRHADTLKRLCLRLCEQLQLKVAGNAFFQFSPGGVSGTVLLEDSHVAIHTWPERNMLKADIHVHQNAKPSCAMQLMEALKTYFQPASSSLDRSRRPTKLN